MEIVSYINTLRKSKKLLKQQVLVVHQTTRSSWHASVGVIVPLPLALLRNASTKNSLTN